MGRLYDCVSFKSRSAEADGLVNNEFRDAGCARVLWRT